MAAPHQHEELTVEEQLRRLSAEHTALNDRYMRLLTNQARDERAAHAAARRTAWESVLFKWDLYVKSRVAEEVRTLCGRIEYLPVKGRAENGECLT